MRQKMRLARKKKTERRTGTRHSRAALILTLAATILAGGCNVGPKYHKPAVTAPPAYKELTPDQFKEVDGWKVAQPQDDTIRGKWWEMFNDSELNDLEEQVNVSNQNIAQAEAVFREERALVKQARSDYYPTVTTSPSVTASRGRAGGGGSTQSSTGTGSTGGGAAAASAGSQPRIVVNYSVPFDATWEPDLFDRVRNTVRASAYAAQASMADLENVRLSFHSDLAADYFQLRGLDAQKDLLDQTVAAYKKALELTRTLFELGIDSDESVAQAETQLESAQAQYIATGIQRALFEHAIAVIVGKPPSAFSIAMRPLKPNPPAVPFGIPSQLLERRPDIAAAERRVAAANAQIGVTKAAFYPALTINGSAGWASTAISTLFTRPNFFWALGSVMSQTLFDAGRRRAVTEQAWASYDATVASYRETVLTAFQGVEDNLATLRILSQELEHQDAAVAAAERSLKLALDRYQLGIDSYLNVITAQTTLLGNQQLALNLRIDQMTASVRLIMALGGGWDTTQLPAPSQITKTH